MSLDSLHYQVCSLSIIWDFTIDYIINIEIGLVQDLIWPVNMELFLSHPVASLQSMAVLEKISEIQTNKASSCHALQTGLWAL